MKTKTASLIVSLFFITSILGQTIAKASEARLFIVGLPHKISSHSESNMLGLCLTLLLQGSKPGDRILYIDAEDIQVIADATIPDGKQFTSNPRARAIRLQGAIAALKQYSNSAKAERLDSDEADQIRVPQFLEMIGSHFGNGSRKPTVLILGRPFYEDRRDSAFTFGTNGLYPSDGHILTNSYSVFGTAHKLGILKGVSAVHWAYLDDNLFRDDHARSVIRRFWAIYVNRLGSTLSSWVSAPEIVFDRATHDVRDPVTDEKLDERDTIIEMRRINFVRVYDQGPHQEPVPASIHHAANQSQAITNANPTPLPSAALDAALTQASTPTNGEISISAAWLVEGGQTAERPDVDLYFYAPGSPALCFRRTAVDTSFGTLRYLRDAQAPQANINESQWKAAWETISLPAGTPIDKCECFVNLYRGCSNPLTGLVRLSNGEKSTTYPFQFPALSGNEGADEEGHHGPCWQRISMTGFGPRE